MAEDHDLASVLRRLGEIAAAQAQSLSSQHINTSTSPPTTSAPPYTLDIADASPQGFTSFGATTSAEFDNTTTAHRPQAAAPPGLTHPSNTFPVPRAQGNERTVSSRTTQQTGRQSVKHLDPRGRRPLPSSVDPSSITKWPEGMRFVTKLSARNPEFEPAVKKLMVRQDSHIKQWEMGREQLLKAQATKREQEQTYRKNITLPGLLGSGPIRTPEFEREELENYDKKVYTSCCTLVELQSTELKNLDVPFFCTRADLVLDDASKNSGSDGDGKITKTELLSLQRQMLKYLEDLFRDW